MSRRDHLPRPLALIYRIRWVLMVSTSVLLGGIAWRYVYLYACEDIVRRRIVALGGEYWRVDAYGIRTANLSNTKVTEEQLEEFTEGRALYKLSLSNTNVTGAGLMRAGEIYYLALDGTRCSDAEMPLISRIPGLRMLDLSNTRVTDEGVASLMGSKLEYLSLEGCGIGNTVGVLLAGIHQLQVLDLSRTAISNTAVAQLQSTSLEYLDLSSTNVSDEGVISLRFCPNLRRLVASHTRISDVSLAAATTWPQLRYLEIEGTGVSPSAVSQLRESRPDLSVYQEK